MLQKLRRSVDSLGRRSKRKDTSAKKLNWFGDWLTFSFKSMI
jgi:hypothetical protein